MNTKPGALPRLVVDTNIIVSALLTSGSPPAQILDAIQEEKAVLLSLKSVAGIPIVSARDAVTRLGL